MADKIIENNQVSVMGKNIRKCSLCQCAEFFFV